MFSLANLFRRVSFEKAGGIFPGQCRASVSDVEPSATIESKLQPCSALRSCHALANYPLSLSKLESHMIGTVYSRSYDALDNVPSACSDNAEHEQTLMRLWNILHPTRPLSGRISRDWESIGFQGENPATDFRGMGVLGLHDLVHFSRAYPVEARQILHDSNQNGLKWYERLTLSH